MKIKWIFLIANSISALIMFTFLFISYIYMVLPVPIIAWLSVITILSLCIANLIHYILTKPVVGSIQLLVKHTHEMEKVKFNSSLPVKGPQEIKELTNRFNEVNLRLQEAFENIKQAESSRRELVANISHDLRTPMSSIKAFVAAIQDGVVKDPSTFQQYLHTINLETERLDQLIQQLFELSLLDSGGMDLHLEAIQVDELLIEILEHEAIHINNKSIEIKVDLPSIIPTIYVDRIYFQKALFNLLDNAIRFSKIGGLITIKVKVLEDKQVQIGIEDEGEGIRQEELPFIFKRTYRIEKSRNLKYGGAGLGLAIVKSIIERHQGDVTANSEFGKGSQFIITLYNYEKYVSQ
jgi:two-component system sensor histidine kinase SaeS